MKRLALGLAALLALAAPVLAAPSYRKSSSFRSRPAARQRSVARAARPGSSRKAAGDVPGWLAHPTPGALIRTAGEGFTISSGGDERNNLDYSAQAREWGSSIVANALYAQNATGVGMQVGPKDKAPAGSGGSGGGAGGNGITTNGTVLGLDAGGNTIATQGH